MRKLVELTADKAGKQCGESRRAIEWMQLALFHPDWRPENLSRIRDLVDQTLNAFRRQRRKTGPTPYPLPIEAGQSAAACDDFFMTDT
jgi:hypothetical protein